MPIVSIETLKGYFNDGDVPTELEYIDLIDTLNQGDMSKSVYDTNDDGKVNSAHSADAAPWSGITGKPATYPATTPVADSNALGGVSASSYLQRTSAARPGVTKLYRSDSDSGYYVRHYWTGTHWYLQGYNASDVFHAGCRVEYANVAPWSGLTGVPSTFTPSAHTHGGGDITSQVSDANTVDSLHAASFARSDADDTITGLWSINNDLRIRDGLYVGSTGVNPTNGNVQATADICAGGGIYAGNAAAAATNGYLEASSHVVANGNFFGRSSDHYFKTSVNIGYGSDVDSNRFKLLNESVNYRIEKAYAGTCILWFNWTGNGAATRTTRCANGNGGYGNIHADNFVNESTRASKRNIRSYKKELPNSLDVVDRIEPIKFKKVNGGHKDQEKERIGFVAEDLAEVLPEVVAFDENGHPEGIAYDQIVPLLVLSIQELRTELEELKRGR